MKKNVVVTGQKKKRNWLMPILEGTIRAFLFWLITDYLCSILPKNDNILVIVCGGGIIISSIMMLYSCVLKEIKLRIALPLCILAEVLVFGLLVFFVSGFFVPGEMTEEVATQVAYFWYAFIMSVIFSRLMVFAILVIKRVRAKNAKKPLKKTFTYPPKNKES